MSARDLHEDLFIRGLRARPLREWRDVLIMPSLLFFQAGTEFLGGRESATGWLLVGVAVFLVAVGTWRLARGSILLDTERLVARHWNPFLLKTVEVPVGDVHKINVAGPIVRVGYREGEQARHLKLRLIAPVAEDLFDRLVEVVEQVPENTGRVQQPGRHRVLVSRESLAPYG